MKLFAVLALAVVGCSAESATWIAQTNNVPVQIAKDTFSAFCLVSGINVTGSTAFQWLNGTKIAPTTRYRITLRPADQSLDNLLVADNLTSAYNWTFLRNTSDLPPADGIALYAQLTILTIQKEEVGGFLCANRSQLPVDALPYSAMGPGMKATKNVIQGDEYCLTCEAYGWPLPDTIAWLKNGSPLVTGNRIYLNNSNNKINATIQFNPVEYEDDAEYSCYTWNTYGNSSEVTMALRVKDRWAALWPFLGIVAEVIVLCAVILMYERHQQSKLVEEDEKDRSTLMNDGAANEKDDHDGVANGDDVRQRPIIKS